MKRRIKTMVGATLVAFALVLGFTDKALAVTYVWEGVEVSDGLFSITWHDSPCATSWWGETTWYVRGCWHEDGDKWRVADGAADSERVGLEWKLTDGRDAGRWGICGNAGGDGNLGECDKDYPEGTHIIFRVGRCDGSVNPCKKPGSGSGWHNWTAWYDATA